MDECKVTSTLFVLLIWGSIIDVCLGRTQKVKATCEDYTRNIFKYSNKESINLNRRELSGIWTSSSCEAYNGPQFILRKYVISQEGKWSADYYHYKDGWCSKPTFTVSMKGFFKVGERNSLGGHQGEFTARSYLLIPHTEEALIELSKVAEQFCPKARLPILSQDKDGKIIVPKLRNYTITKDVYRNSFCRNRFGIHLYTHKVIRVLRDKSTGNINDQLYFGETPTRQTRRSFTPSAYHFPLSRSSSHCKICDKLESATPQKKVILSQPKKSWKIEDEWTSPTCQAVSDTFMSRFLKFSPVDSKGQRAWKLVYYFFLDSLCKVLSYKISAKGTYTKPNKSANIAGAFEVEFNLTDTEITPYEMLIVELLQAEPEGTCGISSKWRAGITQSVKSTRGCRMFRINIPSIEYDVLKTIKKGDDLVELYTGQSSTDNIVPNSPEKRPTSFQLPLRRCSDIVTGVQREKKPTVTTPRTRKIDVYVPDFTIPKNLFKTEPPKQTQPKSVKREKTGNNESIHVDASSHGMPVLKRGRLPVLWIIVSICTMLILNK